MKTQQKAVTGPNPPRVRIYLAHVKGVYAQTRTTGLHANCSIEWARIIGPLTPTFRTAPHGKSETDRLGVCELCEIRKMTRSALKSYRNILIMSLGCIASGEDRILTMGQLECVETVRWERTEAALDREATKTKVESIPWAGSVVRMAETAVRAEAVMPPHRDPPTDLKRPIAERPTKVIPMKVVRKTRRKKQKTGGDPESVNAALDPRPKTPRGFVGTGRSAKLPNRPATTEREREESGGGDGVTHLVPARASVTWLTAELETLNRVAVSGPLTTVQQQRVRILQAALRARGRV